MEVMFNTNDRIPDHTKVAFKISYSGYVSCPNTQFESGENCLIINDVLKKNDRQTVIDEIVQKMNSNDKII